MLTYLRLFLGFVNPFLNISTGSIIDQIHKLQFWILDIFIALSSALHWRWGSFSAFLLVGEEALFFLSRAQDINSFQGLPQKKLVQCKLLHFSVLLNKSDQVSATERRNLFSLFPAFCETQEDLTEILTVKRNAEGICFGVGLSQQMQKPHQIGEFHVIISLGAWSPTARDNGTWHLVTITLSSADELLLLNWDVASHVCHCQWPVSSLKLECFMSCQTQSTQNV